MAQIDKTPYYANKHRYRAWLELAVAREIKHRVETSRAHLWEHPKIAAHVRLARMAMHMHLTCARTARPLTRR